MVKSSKSIYYWFFLFALCSVATQQVQDNIRPNYAGDGVTIKYLLGVAPNFFPSIGLPALFFILIPVVNHKKSANKWLNEKKYLTGNVISLIGLLGWESLQTLTLKGHSDWHDVLWTIIGAMIFQLIWLITPNSYKAVST